MKKLSLFFIGLLLIPALFFTSCDRGDDPTDNNSVVTAPDFELMKEYMVDNDLDIDKILTNTDGQKFVVGVSGGLTDTEAEAFLADYYIMDIRQETHFLTAHVDGANNVAFTDILTEAENADKPILVICYTGQSACYATALLRMYDPEYADTRALKWGMSGWDSGTTSWNGNIGTISTSSWSFDGAPTNVTYSDPELIADASDGASILKERVEAVVAAGFQSVSGTEVLANPSNYFINNYFDESEYDGFGHITGAYRVKPLLLSDSSYLSLNPDAETVVTYCYTGQTSGVLTAVLNVLGYNAKSLLFGMNGMDHDNSYWPTSTNAGNRWLSTFAKDYPVYSN